MEGISHDLLMKLIQVLIMHQCCQHWVVLENFNWVHGSLFYIPLPTVSEILEKIKISINTFEKITNTGARQGGASLLVSAPARTLTPP